MPPISPFYSARTNISKFGMEIHRSSNGSGPSTNAENCQEQQQKTASSPVQPLIIPTGAEQLPYQIAGHRFGKSKTKLGLLKHSQSGDIMKPVYDKRSRKEKKFYEMVFATENDQDAAICALRRLVPRFNGLFHDDRMNIDYIRMEDVTANLDNVSLLDIKMGAITYDPEATEEKRRTEMAKYPYAKQLGFRLLGMRIYDPSTKQFHYHNKEFGLNVTPETAADALKMFAKNDLNVMETFLGRLHQVEDWFRTHNVNRWKFISSSVLLAYGERKQPSSGNDDNGQKSGGSYPRPALVKLIDFAHVFPNVGLDENYLYGLVNLQKYLRKAIDQCAR